MTDAIHPARSADLLSRLHDGELSTEEKSRFESHLAGCPACRSAVDAFEGSLAAFRAAPTSLPASDLSARILRKIRAQSPSRRPFEITFGIDVRWAGAVIAALLVAIIVAPALLHRPTPTATAKKAPDAIPVYLADREPEPKQAPSEAHPAARVAGAAPAQPLRKAEAADRAAAPARAPAPASAGAASEEVAQQNVAAPSKSLRLNVRPLDGAGEAPALATLPSDAALSALRGKEFILLVEADGHVRDAMPNPPGRDEPAAKSKDASAASARRDDQAEVLRSLRFAAGDRLRRLLVRVE